MKGAIDEAVPDVLVSDVMPPCQVACPANVDARGYIGLVAAGRYDDAFELHLEKNPIPAIIGRVCPHPCEDACRRGEEDEPVTICWIKRFMADNVSAERLNKVYTPPKIRKGKKVAVIGAGPAGMSAAFYLAKCGYDVTVFDRFPKVGGMLTVGIPEYRLPESIVEKEVENLKRLGVKIQLNTPFGPGGLTLDDLKKQDFAAVFLGIGAHEPMELEIEGEHLIGVIPGEVFLARDRLGQDIGMGKKVAIVGGGNTAIDCARVALRMGADKVTILYRRTRKEMPALDAEVEDALEEGVKVEFLVAPVRVLGRDYVKQLELLRMELGPPDESGRRRPVQIKGSEYTIDVDTVIPAISRTPETDWLKEAGLDCNKRDAIVVDPETGRTNRENIFAAGDAVTGPSIAIDAIGTARKAAMGIDRHLNGGQLSEYWSNAFNREDTMKNRYEDLPNREHPEKLDPKERITNFDEVEKTYPRTIAIKQAERCLSCMTQRCIACHICEKNCPTRAITVRDSQNGERMVDVYELDYGRCQFCKICVEMCPTTTLSHTPDFGLGTYTRKGAVYGKNRMLGVDQ
jgi:putative selenate reductase YgfK subunit